MPLTDIMQPDKQTEQDKVETIKSAIQALFERKGMRMKSILKPKQIPYLVAAIVYADRTKSKMAQTIIDALLELPVSQYGSGRKDVTKILTAIISSEDQDAKDNKSLLRKLMG